MTFARASAFPKERARPKRNDRIGKPATMHANNAHSSVAQAFEARRHAIVREARALFWQLMRALRALDAEWGL